MYVWWHTGENSQPLLSAWAWAVLSAHVWKSRRAQFPPPSAPATFQKRAVCTVFTPALLINYFDSLLLTRGEFTTSFLLPPRQLCKDSACSRHLCMLVWKGCFCMVLLQCKCFRLQCSKVIKYMLDLKSMNDLWICLFVLRTKPLKKGIAWMPAAQLFLNSPPITNLRAFALVETKVG